MIRIRIGRATVNAEVADTPLKLALGLMFRKRLAPGTGMLLRFPRTANHYLHMWFVRFPLDVVFIGGNGIVYRIHRARPWDGPFCAGGPVRFVLEADAGWCAKNGVRAGARVRFPACRQ